MTPLHSIYLQLRSLPHDGNFFMGCVVELASTGKIVDCLQMIRDQAIDNRAKMEKLIGKELLKQIESL